MEHDDREGQIWALCARRPGTVRSIFWKRGRNGGGSNDRCAPQDSEPGIVYVYDFFDDSAGDTRDFQTPDGRKVTAGPQQPWTWEITRPVSADSQISDSESLGLVATN